ncbi:MAG: serine/threonine-protein kinase [Planctomycetota bacterium]
MPTLRARQKLGKYRIERCLAEGGFAEVYRALDTIEGMRVALKLPRRHLMTREALDRFRQEVRLTAQLDHPNILPLKNAAFIGDRFVISYPLGERSLGERLSKRISQRAALELFDQMMCGLAFAHSKRIIHCDVKPENFILFPGNRVRLTDFGIARVALHTVEASGSGTVGYIAPEQAMGKPSFHSDVFSAGLILHRMLSGELPQWPFEWPLPGHERLRRKLHPDLIQFIRKALEVAPQARFPDAGSMYDRFRKLRARALNHSPRRRRRKIAPTATRDWKEVRRQQFLRQYRRVLEVTGECSRCKGPTSERMKACPWCGTVQRQYRGDTRFPSSCPRCRRGMKLDWRFCPWCFGPGFEPTTTRSYSDVRYQGRCSNSACSRRQLMPFMRYCPWCRRKVTRRWRLPGSSESCSRCGWGILSAYWDHCPWCAIKLRR